jgi:hypothetical protein
VSADGRRVCLAEVELDPGMDAPARHRTRFTQRLGKEAPIRFVPKNRFVTIASGHDVIKGPGILNTNAAGRTLLLMQSALLSRFDA